MVSLAALARTGLLAREPWLGCALYHSSHGQVEILGCPGLLKPQFERVAALQNPTMARGVGEVEHASEQAIEGDLTPQPLQVDIVPP